MKERGILFKGEMVKAILDGTKTQTRRIVKPQPSENIWDCLRGCQPMRRRKYEYMGDGSIEISIKPYAFVGDRLYCKEAWATGDKLDKYNATQIAEMAEEAGFEGMNPKCPLLYKDDSRIQWGHNDLADFGPFGRWRSPRFMPKWASRITLEITEVRVERVQEISEGDARAEGVSWPEGAQESNIRKWGSEQTARMRFADLWDSINAKRGYSWESNPWVWVITFRRMQ